ncbi:family 43 glycosylhydrolase [Algibacillus agarilyticus]|uniref:family 43 glycosylhydrolase n=1 Tax=Algibacillus agarilyticus TaxID=2234133 RepID=UPI001E613DEE|nr:family 43 glycosylhydrolase [Algibacillus agarilyticus]
MQCISNFKGAINTPIVSLVAGTRFIIMALLFITTLAGCNLTQNSNSEQDKQLQIAADTFANPVLRNGADPWMHYYEGNYYLTTTTWTSQLVMRKSPTIAGLADAPAHYIWSGSDPSRAFNFWAFEFHPIERPEGLRWYVIITSGVEENFGGQRNHILESEGTDPMGPYQYKGTPMPDHWNIDGSYFEHKGALYFTWSEWLGPEQVNLVSKMTNPWTLEGERNVITRPEYKWEQSGLKVNEGPEIIKHNGRVFLTHSASFCNTEDYKLAVVELIGDDPVKPESWHKFDKPFFSKANGVYGPGHHGFFTSPDGSEEWLIYHGNSSPTDGCSGTRSTRAQPFTWSENGLPNFGEPIMDKQALAVPSGEQGPLTAQVQGVKYKVVNRGSNLCLVADAQGVVSAQDCTADNAEWVVDPANDGLFRLVNSDFGTFMSQADCATDAQGVMAQPWISSNCQRWHVDASELGWVRFANAESLSHLQIAGCGSASGSAVVTGGDRFTQCTDWRLEPVSTLAMINANSGKVVSVEGCSADVDANITQVEYKDLACQKWQASPTENGFYTFKSLNTDNLCLAVNGQSDGKVDIADNVVQAKCNEKDSEWRFELLPNGALRMVSHYGLALKIGNCSLKNDDNVMQEVWKDTICQHFYFREAE